MALLLLPRGAEARQDAGVPVGGTVKLKGAAPKITIFKTDSDPEAEKSYPEGFSVAPVDVDGKNRVRSALVYVKKGLEGRTFDPPKEAKALDVRDFQVTPRVLGMMAGQKLVITSHDDTLHAFHALPFENKEFNTGFPKKGDTETKTFTQAEMGIKVKCETHHDWELSWISVFTHPYYAVTDDQGRFQIKGLPPGKYTLEAWQENCAAVTREIQVKDQELKDADLELTVKPPERK